MKRTVQWTFAPVLSLALLLASTNAYPATTFSFQANGVSAQTQACVNNCSSQLYLTLYSNGTSSWAVFFSVFGSDSSGNTTSISGYGQIPASMISGTGHSNLALNLDTAAAGLQVQYCVTDQSYNTTCTPYSGGVITVSWQATNLVDNHIAQQNSVTTPAFTQHFNLQSDTTSATAQSNAFGMLFSDQLAQLGTAHQGGVSIY